MTDAHTLGQIEYRHHPTKDLAPFASSMTPNELAAADEKIRPWVRHPHDDKLSESACYQLLDNGQAALAWRYRDERAARRPDATIGRPLVSRALVGPSTALTFRVALALCRAGLSTDWAGALPCDVASDSDVPAVSARIVAELADEMAPKLDEAVVDQQALQAVVAAALADPDSPLAIGMPGNLVREPLRECVQVPLLWGLLQVTRVLLGQAGRGWSFSTFELPLGELDPASLPGIVFREARDAGKAAPSRWRPETKVRPFDANALGSGTSYARMAELAGALIDKHRKQSGAALEQFIKKCGAHQGPIDVRIERVEEGLRNERKPRVSRHGKSAAEHRPGATDAATAAAEHGDYLADPALISAQAGTLPGVVGSEPAAQSSQAVGYQDTDNGRADAAQLEDPRHPGPYGTAQQGQPPAPDGARSGDAMPEDPRRSADPRYQGSVSDPTVMVPAVSRTDATRPSVPMDPGWTAGSGQGQHMPGGPGQGQRPAVLTGAGNSGLGTPPPQPHGDPGQHQPQYPAQYHPLANPRDGQQPPQLPVRGYGGPAGSALSQQGAAQHSVSAVLWELQFPVTDQRQFQVMLDAVCRAHDMSPTEREKSWRVVSSDDWYVNILRNGGDFRARDLESIFGAIIIPDLIMQPPVEEVTRWAREAPVAMIVSLLAAAKTAGPQPWDVAKWILEPVLASRWAVDNLMRDVWGNGPEQRYSIGPGNGGGFSRFLRRLLFWRGQGDQS